MRSEGEMWTSPKIRNSRSRKAKSDDPDDRSYDDGRKKLIQPVDSCKTDNQADNDVDKTDKGPTDWKAP